MKDIYLYLLLGVFLYFLFTRVLERFNNNISENFDPSLVPVSSIVTLAKVAQKLVNGNGTLTNPGNLQIGASTGTPGNLTVMGGTIINGANAPDGISLNVTGPTKITGDTTIGGALITGTASGTNYIKGTTNMNTINANSIGVTGNTTVTGESTGAVLAAKNGTTNSTYKFIPGGSAWAGGVAANALNLYAYGTNGIKNIANFNDDGSTNLFGNTSVGGALTANGNINLSAGSENKGINITSGNPYIAFNKTGSPGAPQLYSDGTTLHAYNAPFQVDKDLTVSGNAKINGIVSDSADQIMLRNLYHGSGGNGGGTSQCLSGDGTNITTKDCDRNDATQYWTYKGVRFVHVSSGKCMTVTENTESYQPDNASQTPKFGLTKCDPILGDQVFRWDQYNRRIHRWKNSFSLRGDSWILQMRLRSPRNLDFYNNSCGDDCVWDAY